ncbi:MAG: TadE-like protein [Actinobacteria bacterium ADurb.Bin346]|nr:MAG: TadE-like protein [Actinobacteria bacterium ADurb.Bin346]
MKRYSSLLYFHNISKKINNQSGAAAVEFALILPILATLFCGILYLGVAYNNWIALTHAAREGARLASVGEYSEERVRDSAPSVEITSINITGAEGNIGSPVSVTVKGIVFDIHIPFIWHWSGQLESTATMRRESSN